MNRSPESRQRAIADHWWVLVSRGIASIALSGVMLARPPRSLDALVLLFGTYCAVDGVVAVIGGYRGAFWHALAAGFVSVLAGACALACPRLSPVALVYLMATWSIARGILEIVVAIEFSRFISGESWLVLAGIISIVFGLYVDRRAAEELLSIAWVLASYAGVLGVLLCLTGIRGTAR